MTLGWPGEPPFSFVTFGWPISLCYLFVVLIFGHLWFINKCYVSKQILI